MLHMSYNIDVPTKQGYIYYEHFEIQSILTIARFPHFTTFTSWGGLLWPPGVSKPNVVALRNNDQSNGLDEYSWLMVYFDPESIFDPVMASLKSIFAFFRKRGFWTLRIDIDETIKDSKMPLSQANFLDVHYKICILRHLYRYCCILRGEPKDHVCQPASTSAGIHYRGVRIGNFLNFVQSEIQC